jgi:hypothetical protein
MTGRATKPGLVTTASEPFFEGPRSLELTRPVQAVEGKAAVAAATRRDATTSQGATGGTVFQEDNLNARDAQEVATKIESATGPEDAPRLPEQPEGETKEDTKDTSATVSSARITFALAAEKPLFGPKALYIPPPRARDDGRLALSVTGPLMLTCNRATVCRKGRDSHA